MKEIEIGLRINPKLEFFGIDEVNQLLSNGMKIRQIIPGGAITKKHQNDSGSANIIFTGFLMTVLLEE